MLPDTNIYLPKLMRQVCQFQRLQVLILCLSLSFSWATFVDQSNKLQYLLSNSES